MSKYQYGNRSRNKLTAVQVYDIRALYARGDCTQGELARDFKVSVIQIGRIVRGEVWQTLPAAGPTDTEQQDVLRRLLQAQEEVSGMTKLQEVAAKTLGPAKGIMNALEGEE